MARLIAAGMPHPLSPVRGLERAGPPSGGLREMKVTARVSALDRIRLTGSDTSSYAGRVAISDAPRAILRRSLVIPCRLDFTPRWEHSTGSGAR
jgi:hypothetical protein